MDGTPIPTRTDQEFDVAVGCITSFYQSKRSRIKKQLTHWIGKFAIVTAENNKLRSINKAITNRNTELFGMIGKMDKEITGLKGEVAEAGKLLAERDDKITGLENQVKELEAGALV